MKDYDAFICHSSEDKRYFVRPLAQKLKDYGVKIWYDEFSLKPGLSLSRSIDKGIGNSNFGIVVLSESFFNKNWTEYELRALNTFEINNPGVIVPLWYKVNIDAVKNFSPYLADKLAIVFDKKSIDEIAVEILEVIREDLFEELHKKRAWEEFKRKSKKELKTLQEQELVNIKIGPIRHEKFPIELITRIRLIRATLFEVYTHSMEFWLEGFQRDMHPENEVHFWELTASCFIESIHQLGASRKSKRDAIFICVLGVIGGINKNLLKSKELNEIEIDTIIKICNLPIPVYDFEDEKFGE